VGSFVCRDIKPNIKRQNYLNTKPKLKLVETTPAPGEPPRPLGAQGAALWKAITVEYGVEDAGGRELLVLACQSLDRAEACREIIDRDGELLRTKTGVRDNPLLKHELNARAFVVKTLHRLGVDLEALKPLGRPPGHSEQPIWRTT
jgi:hypothetical protein